jgi:hypothetical protein
MVDGLTHSKLSQLMNFIEAFESVSAASSGSMKKPSKNAEVASTAGTDDLRTLAKQWSMSDPDSPKGSYRSFSDLSQLLSTPSKESIPSIWEEGLDLISDNESQHGNSIADDAAYLATPDPLDLMPYAGVSPKFSEKDIADHAAALKRRLEEEMARQNALFCGMMQQAQAMR